MKNSITFKNSMTYHLLIAFLTSLLFTSFSNAQVNCSDETPHITVDLSADPSMTIETISVIRDGNCCDGADENCVEFTIFLHPDAEGILFDVASGANPGGALDYQINCGPITASGSAPICLDGAGPHFISFCKPGANQNTYEISSVPGPSASDDVVAADGCTDTLSVDGLDPETITWNSISPGNTGDYNHLLSDENQNETGITGEGFTGYETVLVTPDDNSPTEIQYEVCGYSVGSCNSNIFCDTISVTIVPDLAVQINPEVPSICAGETNVDLTANVEGGAPPYNFIWSTGETTQSINVSEGGTYEVSVGDQTGCFNATDTVEVVVFENPITADAGPDISVCHVPLPTISITGIVTGTTTGEWSGGQGTYEGSTSDLTLEYTPTAAEINNGSVTLTLTPTNTASCSFTTDEVTINLTSFTSDVAIISSDVTCYNAGDGEIVLDVTQGNPPYNITSYNWSNSETTQSINNLTPGTYDVIITDENGCELELSADIVQPDSMEVTINGDEILCFGGSNGNVTGSISGGTAPYEITLNETGAQLTVTNDGDNYDFSSLDGLPSGGFEEYTVTVTDANGSIGGCLVSVGPVTMVEPEELLVSINGDNILCFGDGDGNVTGSISGGTAPYEITLNETGAQLTVTNDGDNYNFSELGGLSSGGFEEYTVTVTDANGSSDGCSTTVGPVTMVEPEELLVSINGDNILCFGDSDGNVTGTISGGTAPYEITLNETGAQLTVTNDGDSYDFSDLDGLPSDGFEEYTVSVTDANGNNGGCATTTGPVVMNEPQPIAATINGDQILCFGDGDGSITGNISGGTPPYTADLNQTGDIRTVMNDGDNYAFDNLNGLPSGGYDQYAVTVTDANGNSRGCRSDVGPAEMREPEALTINVEGDEILCFGDNDGTISGSVSGGIPPYSLTLNETGEVLTVSNEGGEYSFENLNGSPSGGYELYSVTVTDANNCSVSDSAIITEPEPLEQDITANTYPSGDNISCFGAEDGSINYSVSGGTLEYEYLWESGETTQNLTNLGPGSYSVTATDANGCTIDTTIILTEPELLEITLEPSIYDEEYNTTGCAPDGSIDAIVSGGSSSYSYEWSTGSNNASVSELEAGTYEVVVIDINGCTVTEEIILNSKPIFTIELDAYVYIGGVNVSCAGAEDGSITLELEDGTAPFNFEWSTGATSQNLTDLSAGEYTVTVTDDNGCIKYDTIVLTEPLPLSVEAFVSTDYNGADISCFEANDGGVSSTVSGGTPNYNYTWTNSEDSLLGNGVDLVNISPGVYVVSITDTNGCAISQNVTVTEPEQVSVTLEPLSDFDGMPVNCENTEDGVVIANPSGGTGDYNFAWDTSPEVNTQTLSNIGVGTYTVTVTDANGCEADSSIVLEGHPLPDFSYSNYGSYCEGDRATISSTTDPSNSCQWVFSTGQVMNNCGEFSIDLNTVGCVDAELFVTNEFGCISSEFIEDYICFEPTPDASFNQSDYEITTIPSNVQFWSNTGGGYHYEWDFGDGFGSSETNPEHFFPDGEAGTYEIQLIVTSMFGCVDTSYSVVEVQEEFIIYVPNTFTPDGDQYNQTFLPVVTSGYDPYTYHLMIFNRWGEVLFESYDASIGWDGTYGGKTVKDGTYIWKINVSDKANAQKREIKGHVNVLR